MPLPSVREEEEGASSKMSKEQSAARFLVLSSVVFFSYLVFGYLLEWFFRQDGMKPFGWYLTLVQFLLYSLFSGFELWRRGEKRKIPMSTYAVLSTTTLLTMGFSNASLGYLNYPTQVIFKCCKLIPVLVGGILIQGKSYGIVHFSAATLMSVGLALFTLADSKVSPNFDTTGVVMISVALAADAIIGNVQEKAMRQHSGVSNTEVIFYSYGMGAIMLALVMVASGSLMPAVRHFAEAPGGRLYLAASVFSFSGYVGMLAVLALVRSFGAFACVTVTSFRKFISITASFILFAKPFTMQYVYSGLLVLAGVYLNLAAKNHRGGGLRLGAILRGVPSLLDRWCKAAFGLNTTAAAEEDKLRRGMQQQV